MGLGHPEIAQTAGDGEGAGISTLPLYRSGFTADPFTGTSEGIRRGVGHGGNGRGAGLGSGVEAIDEPSWGIGNDDGLEFEFVRSSINGAAWSEYVSASRAYIETSAEC